MIHVQLIYGCEHQQEPRHLDALTDRTNVTRSVNSDSGIETATRRWQFARAESEVAGYANYELILWLIKNTKR